MKKHLHLAFSPSSAQGKFILPAVLTVWLHHELEGQLPSVAARCAFNDGKPKAAEDAIRQLASFFKKAGFTRAGAISSSEGKRTKDPATASFTVNIAIDGNDSVFRLLVGRALRDPLSFNHPDMINLMREQDATIPPADRTACSHHGVGLPEAVRHLIDRLEAGTLVVDDGSDDANQPTA